MEERLRSHYESLSRVIGWTRVADAKATPILALHTALLGTTASNATAIGQTLEGDSCFKAIVLGVLLAVFFGSTIFAVVFAARVYLPQTRPAGTSKIYFASISNMSLDQFKDLAKLTDEEQIEDDLVQQIHVVSLIASRKMVWVRQAFLASAPALAAWIVIFVTAG